MSGNHEFGYIDSSKVYNALVIGPFLGVNRQDPKRAREAVIEKLASVGVYPVKIGNARLFAGADIVMAISELSKANFEDESED